jgi:ketosteroid isomerase-like protein
LRKRYVDRTLAVITTQESAMLRMLAALILLASVETARAQQPQGAPTASSTARAEVQKFVRDYVDAHNRADATSLSEAVSHRAEVTSVNNGVITRGWDAIRAGTDEIAGAQGSFNLAIGTTDVTMLGSSYALVLAPTAITARNQQGQVVQIKGAMTLVLQKGPEGWKILNEHYSSKAP